MQVFEDLKPLVISGKNHGIVMGGIARGVEADDELLEHVIIIWPGFNNTPYYTAREPDRSLLPYFAEMHARRLRYVEGIADAGGTKCVVRLRLRLLAPAGGIKFVV